MRLVSIKFSLLFVLFSVPHCSKLYHVYNNNYNNNNSFVVLICLQPFCKQYIYKLFFPHDYSLFCPNLSVIADFYSLHHHSSDLPTRNKLTAVCSVQSFYSPIHLVEHSGNGSFLFLPSKEVYRVRLYMFILIHGFSSCLYLLV